MTADEIRAALQAIARQELALDGELPDGDLSGQLDSVQLLTLVVGIEDRFEIVLEPEDEAGLRTVDDVVSVIQAKLASASEPAHA